MRFIVISAFGLTAGTVNSACLLGTPMAKLHAWNSLLTRARTRSPGLSQGQYQRTPAQFRETALDTHKVVPAHDFGPSPDLLPPDFRGAPDYLTQLKTQAARTRQRRSQSATRGQFASGTGTGPEQIEYKSVFKPRPDQEHVCNLAKARRQNTFNSEYALIDTLEVHLHNQELGQRAAVRARAASAQRTYLDGQVREKQHIEQRELEARARDEEVARREREAALLEEQRKLEAQRAKNVLLRQQMKDQVRGRHGEPRGGTGQGQGRAAFHQGSC